MDFIYVGSYTAGSTGWTDKCVIGPAGDIAALGTITGGTITSLGTISGVTLTINSGTFETLACSGNTGTFFNNPSTIGVFFLQNAVAAGNGYGWAEICGSSSGMAYIDFTTVGVENKGRYSY